MFLVAGATATIAGCGEGAEQQFETGGKGGKGGSLESNAEQGQGDQQGQAGGEMPGGAKDGGQLRAIRPGESVYGTSFVNPLVELYGDVYVGQRSFVAGNTVLRAAPERTLKIGNQTNAQDNIIARSLDENSSIGDETTLAHHAIIRDSTIGDFAFVGFDAEIINSTVENGALISAGALLENVRIPEDTLVPPGMKVTTQEQADALTKVTGAEEEFKREVLDVNAEFAESYIELYEQEGYEALIGVGPNPVTSFNPNQVEPRIGDAEVEEFARIVGDVSLGSSSEVGLRAAIRADEGSPIIIGSNANIEERVTFHALKGTRIDAGNNLTVGDDSTIHGPKEIGDNLTVGEDSVVFRVRVGDNVTIGDDAVVQGPANEHGELELEIPEGTVIPDGAVVTSEEELAAINT
jgi:carbonic anhydrase/acetyltransferase-like protein (isoleucine patch superfamily)